jgi:dCMP deaminase
MERMSKNDYYLSIAKAISQRSPCLKMKVGAIIVKDDSIISTGYNGPARGEPHCRTCPRIDKPHGSSYIEECPAVHAEENAIINAARQGSSVIGGILYLWASEIKVKEPCYRCRRMIKNAGIKKVISG